MQLTPGKGCGPFSTLWYTLTRNPAFWGDTLCYFSQACPGQVRFQLRSEEKDVKDSVSSAWQWPNLAGGCCMNAGELARVRFDFNRKATSLKFMQQGSRPKRISRWWCLLSALITPCHLKNYIKQMFLQIIQVSFIRQGESQNSYLCLCTKNVASQEAFKWWLLFVLLPDNVLRMDDNSQTASSIAQMQP